jgi:hypothetical protein
MKYLIVSGDSFTDGAFTTPHHPDMDCSWPKWPEILAEKLGMKLVNLAICGKGNEFIYASLQDYILRMDDKDEIGLVVAAWSQCQRRDYQWAGNWWDNRTDAKGDIVYWVNRSLRYFSAFEMMCQAHNIPYAHTQMIELYENYLEGGIGGFYDNDGVKYAGNYDRDEEKILKLILEYDKILDTSKFIGWPLVPKVGGNSLNRLAFGKHERDETPWIISELDNHPNAKGQVKLAEYIHDRLG